MRHGMNDGFGLFEQPHGFEIGHDPLARFKTVQPAIGFRHTIVQRAVPVQDVDLFEVVPLADFKVVEVMRGRDLHRAGALFRVGVFVRNNRDQPVRQRQAYHLPNQMLVAFVVGMHRDRGIAQHGLGPRGGHHQELPVRARDRIFDVPEVTLDLDILDFEIAHRRLQPRVPVDQPLVLVDQPLAVELHEYFQDRAAQPFVHREAFARPVGRGTKPPQLFANRAARLVLPLPHRFEEFLAPHRHAALLPLGQLPFDHQLGGDAGMVHARLPQHILAPHPLEPGQGVLQRVVQRMADMQPPGHVRRRDYDAERFRIRPAPGGKGAGFQPLGINPLFDIAGIESLFEHGNENL